MYKPLNYESATFLVLYLFLFVFCYLLKVGLNINIKDTVQTQALLMLHVCFLSTVVILKPDSKFLCSVDPVHSCGCRCPLGRHPWWWCPKRPPAHYHAHMRQSVSFSGLHSLWMWPRDVGLCSINLLTLVLTT